MNIPSVDYAHLTSNPVLGKSTASHWGRNDVAINLAIQMLGNRRPLDVAILGSGVFEPLTTAASLRLPAGSCVWAFDASEAVIAGLNSILTTSRDLVQGGDQSILGPRLDLCQYSSREYLETLGIETGLILDDTLRIAVDPILTHRLRVRLVDILNLPQIWSDEQKSWDLIVCNNVLPGISILNQPGTVSQFVKNLWNFSRPGGLILIGTIDSHVYKSSRHPKGLEHFASEAAYAIHSSPWELLLWIERAFVQEPYGQLLLLDGYTYFILGREVERITSQEIFQQHVLPFGIRDALYCRQNVSEEQLWKLLDHHHIVGAIRIGGTFASILLSSPFPKSVISILGKSNVADHTFKICEQLLLGEGW